MENKAISTNTPTSARAIELVVAEYSALRDEIMKRSEFRYQITSLTVIAAGTIFTFGLQLDSPASILLVYPVLALFLAGIWAHNVRASRMVAIYIKENIENKVAGLGWESWLAKKQFSILGILSTIGIFLSTQVVAVILGLLKSNFTAIDIVLLAIDAIAFGLTVVLLRTTARAV
jgi:hypothetical protein